MLTKRDLEVIEFIKKMKAAKTSTIRDIFYPSTRVANRRLEEIIKAKGLKRERDNVTTEYVYYINKPRQLRHTLLLSELYKHFHLSTEIVKFEKEYIAGELRADGLIGYRHNGKGYIAFLEVEISNKGLDIGKYKRFFLSGEYKNHLPTIPLIYAVTNQKVETDKPKIS